MEGLSKSSKNEVVKLGTSLRFCKRFKQKLPNPNCKGGRSLCFRGRVKQKRRGLGQGVAWAMGEFGQGARSGRGGHDGQDDCMVKLLFEPSVRAKNALGFERRPWMEEIIEATPIIKLVIRHSMIQVCVAWRGTALNGGLPTL